VRGYGFQRLGPVGDEGKALGGASELLGTFELRFPLWPALPSLGGVAFVDAGQLSLDPWDFRPSKLRASPGVGFRYATPIGPVRLDLAFPVSPPSGTQPWRIWVSVGQAF
jgi:outer membrane translocation and assembly module TamA